MNSIIFNMQPSATRKEGGRKKEREKQQRKKKLNSTSLRSTPLHTCSYQYMERGSTELVVMDQREEHCYPELMTHSRVEVFFKQVQPARLLVYF